MRRERKRRDRIAWTDEHREALIDHDWFRIFRSIDERRECWECMRDSILAEHIEKHPFTRPDVWWQFDAPELRRCTSAALHPFDRPAFQAYQQQIREQYGDKPAAELAKTWFGVPCISGPPELDSRVNQFETEGEYLIRLDLLTDHERQLLAQGETK